MLLQATAWTAGVRILTVGKTFSLYFTVSRPALGPNQTPI
jgi:hypothetical protein